MYSDVRIRRIHIVAIATIKILLTGKEQSLSILTEERSLWFIICLLYHMQF